MQAVKQFDTTPEVELRKALWAIGLRYSLRRRVHETRPDLVFPREMVAVFVDGCFWHGCPAHYSAPVRNAKFWRDKLRYNRSKDRRDVRRLRAANWVVVRVWECAVRCDVAQTVDMVQLAVRARRRIGKRGAASV
jgi:DNA mismatch endonuclease (patch repair protein)